MFILPGKRTRIKHCRRGEILPPAGQQYILRSSRNSENDQGFFFVWKKMWKFYCNAWTDLSFLIWGTTQYRNSFPLSILSQSLWNCSKGQASHCCHWGFDFFHSTALENACFKVSMISSTCMREKKNKPSVHSLSIAGLKNFNKEEILIIIEQENW